MSKKDELYGELSSAIKILAADAVEKAASGHPGMPIGIAELLTSLVFDFLKFNPGDPKWFNRDRLVLSAGHGSMALYSLFYLTGYKNFTLDDIKNFRRLGSKTPGHPEYGEYEGVETTTGPLGQGLATSVGMAIAGKKYENFFGKDICDYKIYCIAGDGCLMEGISYEAASLAGHLALDNLIILFDDNKITIDGSTDLTISEDQIAKFKALGWEAESVDGKDFTQIGEALSRARSSSKPYFIACRTKIARGAGSKEGSEVSHGSPLGKEAISALKKNLGLRDEPFYIPEEIKKTWLKAWERNEAEYSRWNKKFAALGESEKAYINFPVIDTSFIKKIKPPEGPEPTRVSSGRVIEALAEVGSKVIFGSADLSFSNNIKNSSSRIISKENFGGNFIHYGIRENAMAAVMNGLAISGFLPVGGTFFIFSDYMKPSLRLSALMKLPIIYIATHDSIGLGEDGPTHQPIEQLACARATPVLKTFRPACFSETLECFESALKNNGGPSMICLTRQKVRVIRGSSETNLSSLGAYILKESPNFKVTLFASGSELALACGASDLLAKEDIGSRVVSVPCFELFFERPEEYISELLYNDSLKVGVEAASPFGWHRIIGRKGLFFGLETFGASAPYEELYEHFGLTPQNIALKIKRALGSVKEIRQIKEKR